MPSPFQASRLRKHADYGLVYNASRKHRSPTLSFFYRERPAPADAADRTPRFGITVPRALGPAVLRNRIKRRLRAVCRALLLLLPPGVDVVLHPRPEAAILAFPRLMSEMEAVFQTVARRIASRADNAPLPRGPRPLKRKPAKPPQ